MKISTSEIYCPFCKKNMFSISEIACEPSFENSEVRILLRCDYCGSTGPSQHVSTLTDENVKVRLLINDWKKRLSNIGDFKNNSKA